MNTATIMGAGTVSFLIDESVNYVTILNNCVTIHLNNNNIFELVSF